MQYKALMSDVDGTLIPYNYYAIPSDAVTQAIKEAQQYLTVCLVTGRNYGFSKKILEKLDLHKGYLVANNGAQVIDLKNETLLYDQPIDSGDLHELVDYFLQHEIPFYVKQDNNEGEFDETDKSFKKGDTLSKGYMLFTLEILSEKMIDKIFDDLAHLSNLSKHKSQHKDPTKFGLGITHINATKMHGINILLEELGLKKDQVIGVGDSYNDFPLLMASGLKVAMGNAIDDLKAIADYVAPSVDDDGMVDVVNKFILKP